MKIRPTCIPDSSVCNSSNAAMSLLMAMKCCSFEHFNTAWAQHLDKRLWKESFNPTTISPADAHCLQYLSAKAGGWWSWRRAESTGPTFVRTDLWKASLLAAG